MEAGFLESHDTFTGLEDSSRSCDFCKLRWELCQKIDRVYGPDVYFDMKDSNLRLNEGFPPVLTLNIGPG